VASLNPTIPARPSPPDATAEAHRTARDSLCVAVGGQLERLLGIVTALALRRGLDPARLGVYTGLRLFLDNTNRSSLGVGLGAVQEIPILRAAGREAEALRIAYVAHTVNSITCLIYGAGLLAWSAWRAPALAGHPLAAEWTWGLAAVAGLALLKRHETFLIAVLRSHREFALTTRVDVLEGIVSAAAVVLGLLLAGFWGLLGAVGLILICKIAYLHAQHPFRFRWAWDGPTAWRLMRTGLPILANTAVFGCVVGLDRALILTLVPNGERAVGLYSIALMGTSWALDLSGRVGLVLYTDYQTAVGRAVDAASMARRVARATELLAAVLGPLFTISYIFMGEFLGLLLPRYVEGLPALRPLLPGMVLLGLAWPARQALIASGRPYRLLAATGLGLAATAPAAIAGLRAFGLVGIAWGMSIGFGATFAATTVAALVGPLGVRATLAHIGRVAAILACCALVAVPATHLPLTHGTAPARWLARGLILAATMLPVLWIAVRCHPAARVGLDFLMTRGFALLRRGRRRDGSS
jgi:O-antigen/teichoic acid export membrane protein